MNVKWNLVLALSCLLLLGMNVALVRQNKALKTRISQPPPAMEAPVGTQMPDLKGMDVRGNRFTVTYGEDPRKVLVFVFSPACGFCSDNWPKWSRLFPELDRNAVRPVGVDVSSSATADYIAQQFGAVPVVTQIDPRDVVDYHLRLTPQTILVDQKGKVEKVWSGVLEDSDVAEIKDRTGRNTSSSGTLH